MTLIINGTGTAQAIAYKVRPAWNSLQDIANLSSCTVLGQFRDDPAFTTDAADVVSAVINLADAANPFAQATGGRQPILTTDTKLGRKTGVFQSNYTSYMNATAAMDYRLPHTMWAVFKGAPDPGKLYQTIIGRYNAAAPERSAIVLRSNGEIAAMFGDCTPLPGHAYRANRWNIALMGYDGIGGVSIKLGGSAWERGTAATEPGAGTTTLALGYSASNGATLNGSIDAFGVFNVDLSASADEATLNALLATIRAEYGMTVPV